MKLKMGQCELEMGGRYLGDIPEATHLRGNPQALREQMARDGFLFIRKLHDPATVKAARMMILQNLKDAGQLDPAAPLEEGLLREGRKGSFLGGSKAVTHRPEFLAVVDSPELMEFFSDFLEAPALTFNYKWMRAVGTGEFTGAHYDVVYMGRGTINLFTCWTPLGDVSYDMGPLAILEGSSHLERLKETYGRMDVDRDNVQGWFSNNPVEMVDGFGGRWLTAEFEMGDALIFGMYTMHGSLTNVSRRVRLSCDTRYQRADEPSDGRWVGENPIAHYAWGKGEMEPMESARKRWGV